MALKFIKFTNGSFLPIFSHNNAYDDTTHIQANTFEYYTLTNAFITMGVGGIFVNANALNGLRLTDYDGNVWTFVLQSQSTMRISVTDPNNSTVSQTISAMYSGSSGWIHYLYVSGDITQGYNIYIASARPSLFTSRYSDQIQMTYLYGRNGNYTYADDVALVNNPQYTTVHLNNRVVTDVFVGCTGVLKVSSERNISGENLYVAPYSAGVGGSNPLIKLSENTITDNPTPEGTDDPYENIDGEGEIPDSENVPIPALPPLTTTSTGIIGLFSPSASEMRDLADFMWTDFGGTGTDVKEVLEEVVQALKRAISNPLDYVVGLNIIPSQGLSKGSSKTIRFGFVSSGVSMATLSNQYFEIDCGSLHFDALCGDTFLDYAPYSKFSIYLPFIGVKDVDANDFVGHTIGVKYHGDVVTGGITAYVTKDGSVMYQYSGCCALSIPLSSDGWGSTIAGAVQVATSLVSGGINGGSAGVATAAAKGAASVAANPSLLSPQVSHSGSVSGSAGCMGVLTPFVIRECVRFHSTSGFNRISGYPSYYYKKLYNVSGYTVVLNANLANIPCTNTEMDEIDQLLKNGVIL